MILKILKRVGGGGGGEEEEEEGEGDCSSWTRYDRVAPGKNREKVKLVCSTSRSVIGNAAVAALLKPLSLSRLLSRVVAKENRHKSQNFVWHPGKN
jgi:hypothetical protein